MGRAAATWSRAVVTGKKTQAIAMDGVGVANLVTPDSNMACACRVKRRFRRDVAKQHDTVSQLFLDLARRARDDAEPMLVRSMEFRTVP